MRHRHHPLHGGWAGGRGHGGTPAGPQVTPVLRREGSWPLLSAELQVGAAPSLEEGGSPDCWNSVPWDSLLETPQSCLSEQMSLLLLRGQACWAQGREPRPPCGGRSSWVSPSPWQTPPTPGPCPKGLATCLPKIPAAPSQALRPQAHPQLMHLCPLLKLLLILELHAVPPPSFRPQTGPSPPKLLHAAPLGCSLCPPQLHMEGSLGDPKSSSDRGQH